ncbi:isochorismatase domain-containing protein [Pyronema domesticum]|uniref:Similar to Isochorismatase domain-containing protein 2, mitochondrial acc. no. Q5PQ71 n=1 Tax=Pyronema omphalodes (strain CBS 100304) TaxID=1076935 RepID=U4KUP4_PYROM|nr:isochorismatase domain-containing protein [Pyronema domesticum]CCX05088.1 Similar to Isochorismatase domain-containing protein 2, mitochondrial; acc. no. Q5PQ71 [Pyronema omphalodes CBS 100304]
MAGIRPHLLICDIQTAFTKAISNYPSVVSTASKLLRASATLNIPVYVTTQNKARLGETIPPQGHEGLEGLDISRAKGIYDKTKFSMVLPELMGDIMGPGYEQGKRVEEDQRRSFAITGIEAHICVTQTALDLLREGHRVYIIADGVSSSNPQEVPIALNRLRHAGAVVTTSESWIYEVMGDAKIAGFKEIISLVKERQAKTRESLQSLL